MTEVVAPVEEESPKSGPLSVGEPDQPEQPSGARGDMADASPLVYGNIGDYSLMLETVRAEGLSVGFVPTMGALHAGHASLVARAARECDVVAVSIFVNPTQFGDATDLASYPRPLDDDLELVAAFGGQVVLAPSVEEMYPGGPGARATTVRVARLGDRWEGAARPGHFDGMATVVTKLLAMTGRCRAYFGEKDFQQLAIVRQLVRDLSLPAEIVGCPTVRDEDGLALSSRNARLSDDQRRQALALSEALRAGATIWQSADPTPDAVVAAMDEVLRATTGVTVDYAALVRAGDLEPATAVGDVSAMRLLVAADVGGVRLIDNLDPADKAIMAEGRIGESR